MDEEAPSNAGIGAGRRPLGKEHQTRKFDAKAKVEFDPKGKKFFDGYAPGQNFRKKGGADLAGEVRQAAQEAPEAIEQQRIPKAAREIAKGYFRQLGGQQEAPPKADEKK
jgi:hypothetical protein